MKYILASLMILSLCGCATTRAIEFHPIDKQDIYLMPKGTNVVIPAGSSLVNEKKQVTHTWTKEESFVVDRPGLFVSKKYVDNVMKVRLAEENK